MALDIGAKLVDMDYIQVYPTCNPLTGIISYVANSRFDGAVLVNKEGHRFTNEGGRRDVISQAILAQTGKCAYLVWGSEIESVGNMTQIHSKEFEQMKEMKLIVQADSLEDAAKEAGLDVQAFLAEIAEYNSFVDGKKDPKYQKTGAFTKVRACKAKPAVRSEICALQVKLSAAFTAPTVWAATPLPTSLCSAALPEKPFRKIKISVYYVIV